MIIKRRWKEPKFQTIIIVTFIIMMFFSTFQITAKSIMQENNDKTIIQSLKADGELAFMDLDNFSSNTHRVTLITGDVVVVSDLSDGKRGISIIPADPSKLGQHFQTFDTPRGTYLVPSGVNLDKLDIELFNLDYLIREGYHTMEKLPVIVSTMDVSEATIQSIENDIKRYKGTLVTSLPKLSMLAIQLPIETIKDSTQALLKREDIEKIWLDRKMHVSLIESVPLIGAPELWDAGYNGAGVEIAILDTGIDSTHPNLDDLDDDPVTIDPKVIRAIDFTDDATVDDLYGHGTHCAGIAAGTGEALSGVGAFSGTHAWYSGAGNNLDNVLEHEFDLTGVGSATLQFQTFYEMEPNYDYGYLKISIDDGITWTTIDTYNGDTDGTYQQIIYDLTPYAGQTILLRFEYITDSSVVYQGWFIDDIEIPEIGFFDDVEGGTGSWVWSGWSTDLPVNKGVAPGALLWNVKVLNQYGWGLWSWIIEGIEYAAFGPDGIANTGDEADIISMSLGGSPTDGTDPTSLAVDAAVDAGVVVVIAAGNAGDYFTIDSPGVARKVITVGASDKYDNLAYFSSKGPTIDFRVKPDMLAPGVDISSSVPYSLFGTYYQSKSGTSMATPHVAGAAALMLQKGVPAGWTATEYVKNTLISTAVDLGYDVYAQGGGRISVPSAAYTEILVDPATVSFGLSTEDVLDNAILTFYNLNSTSSRSLNLNVSVEDIYTGTSEDCASLNTTILNIEPNSKASIILTIDTTALKSIYSGKIMADIDTGETIYIIFGFAKMHELTITKIDMDGALAAYDTVYVIGDPGFPSWSYKVLDENGKATFYVTDGTYHIISTGQDWDEDATVYTIAENITVIQDSYVYLDERNTVSINFDMNKPDQIMAEKCGSLFYEGEQGRYRFSGLWWYPSTAITFISPTSINTGFAYSYYPEAFYNMSAPGLIDTAEWHKLLFTLENVAGYTTFMADYNSLVRRITDYKVAMVSDVAEWVQYVLDPIAWGSWTFIWDMNVPQSRVEWLSSEPAEYGGWYSKLDPLWSWDFSPPWRSYPIGEEYLAFGEHPFTSGADVYVGTYYMRLSGSISKDTFENTFANYTRNVSGNMIVIQDGLEVYSSEIWDRFWEYYYFSGTPDFKVIIEGICGLNLSTSTYTELSFTADWTKDYQPPRVLMRPRGSNLYCIVPSCDMLVNVTLIDDSLLSSFTMEYSLNDSITWQLASSTQQDSNLWVADLGILSDIYVSLRVNATDSNGNKISQTTIKAFYVSVNVSLDPDHGRKGETVKVTGSGIPAGTTINVYWDSVKFWDGEKGLLNSTSARASGTYEVWFRVPEAVAGTHYVWVEFTATGDFECAAFVVLEQIVISDFSSCFASNQVRMIYPSDSRDKPLGVKAAMLSDWTASGFIYPKLGAVTEGVDTDPGFVDQSTGKALGDPGVGIITLGGPDVNLVVYYAENNDSAPIHFIIGSDRFYFRHRNGTDIPGADLPKAVINFNEDMFVIEVFRDQDGRYVLICQGFGWKGTYAGGKYFDRVIYPEIGSHTESWIIVKWEDTNGDGFVNAPGDGDTYTIIAIGS